MTFHSSRRPFAAAALVAAMTTASAAREPVLRDAYQPVFRVGVAVGTDQLMARDPRYLALVARHFNTATPENLLKWESVHPAEDVYDFKPADRFVAFCEQHDLFMVGHALVWHHQTPAWVFEDASGKPLNRETLLGRMRDHIQTVVGRYRGRIHAWDVVNEALNDDGSLRDTPWRRIIGDDYLEQAMRFAHQADPDAELYYNDYSLCEPAKRRGAVRLVKRLQQAGCRIDGVGIQGHWGMDYPTIDEAEQAIRAFGDLGVKVMITELDVNVLPEPTDQQGADVALRIERAEQLDPYREGLPDAVQQALADRYAEFFRLFVRHRDVIDRVTLWGLDDGGTWRNDWPVAGRTAHPLLFDRAREPKPAFHAVVREAGGAADN